MALTASIGLPCLGCDGLIGLDTPIAAREDAGKPSDAGLDAPQDVACADGSTACVNSCSDLRIDSENCGTCGHSCLGGTCRAGACLPQTLAVGNPARIAVDGTYVYWTDPVAEAVFSSPVSPPDAGDVVDAGGFVAPDTSGDATTSTSTTTTMTKWVASGAFAVPTSSGEIGFGSFGLTGGIAIRNGRVYFAENFPFEQSIPQARIFACPSGSAGCDSPASLVSPQSPFVGALVTDDQNVYWMSGASIYESPLDAFVDGGASAPVLLAQYAGGGTWALAVANGAIDFWNGYGLGSCSVADCACASGNGPGSCPLGPQNSLTVTAIAIGTSAVYWTDLTQGEVIATPLPAAMAGAPRAGVMATVNAPRNIAIDSDNVYFTSQEDEGSIFKCAVGGCGGVPTLIAANLGGMYDLAIDAKRIYAVVGSTNDSNAGEPPLVGNAIVWVAK